MEYLKSTMNVRKEIIDISDEQNRNYWATRLGVSGEKLKTAVRAVQSMEFARLKEYLNLEKIKSSHSFQRFVNP